jgi:hypothetical protein
MSNVNREDTKKETIRRKKPHIYGENLGHQSTALKKEDYVGISDMIKEMQSTSGYKWIEEHILNKDEKDLLRKVIQGDNNQCIDYFNRGSLNYIRILKESFDRIHNIASEVRKEGVKNA